MGGHRIESRYIYHKITLKWMSIHCFLVKDKMFKSNPDIYIINIGTSDIHACTEAVALDMET